jgi:hypothetical protein
VIHGGAERGDLRGNGLERSGQVIQTRIGPLFDHLSHFCPLTRDFSADEVRAHTARAAVRASATTVLAKLEQTARFV